MTRPRGNNAHAAQQAGQRRSGDQEADLSRAAFYGLILRQQGYAPDEAAALVIERYPQARPLLERLRPIRQQAAKVIPEQPLGSRRPPVVDPLGARKDDDD